jgi:hypothetical protein
LILEVQYLLDGSTCETQWARADQEDLENLITQVSGGTQEIVTVTNLRQRVPHGKASRSYSYSAYAVRDVFEEDNETYDAWIKKGAELYRDHGPVRGLDLWHAWSRSAVNYDAKALDAKWATFGPAPRAMLDPPEHGGEVVIVSYWNHDPFVPYTFGNWHDQANLENVVANGSPGDMYVKPAHRDGDYDDPPMFEVYIHGERGFALLVLGNVRGSVSEYASMEAAKAAAMATHAMMSADGEF